MAAPLGNQFWKMRSKHGRDRIFTEPNIMLEACYDYFRYQSEKMHNKKEAVKGGEFTGQIIDVPTITPFSFRLMCSYLHVHSLYFNEFEKALKPNESEIDKDFSNVITHVREIIEEQQFEGAAVGAFSTNLIARRLGMADKVNSEVSGPGGKAIEHDHTFKIEFMSTNAGVSDSEKDIQNEVNKELGIDENI